MATSLRHVFTNSRYTNLFGSRVGAGVAVLAVAAASMPVLEEFE